MLHTAWKINPAVYSDGLTGDTVIEMSYLPPVPLPDKQCPGCPAGVIGGIYNSEDEGWYCWPHYDQVARHPDAWQDDYYTGRTYMEYED